MRQGKCVVIDVRVEDGEGRAEGASAKARGRRERGPKASSREFGHSQAPSGSSRYVTLEF